MTPWELKTVAVYDGACHSTTDVTLIHGSLTFARNSIRGLAFCSDVQLRYALP